MDKGLAKINSGQGDFDIMFGMNVWAVGRSIAAGLLRPINHDYIPNLAANVWDSFQSPFYDVGCAVLAPVLASGPRASSGATTSSNIDPRQHGQPVRRLLGQPAEGQDAPAGQRAGRAGDADVPRRADRRERRPTPPTITKAKDDIAQIAQAVGGLQYDHVDYTDVPTGKAWLHQSWSGNVERRGGVPARQEPRPTNLSYYWPGSDGHPANVDNDTIVLLTTGQEPGAGAPARRTGCSTTRTRCANFTNTTGYQMPVKAMTPESMVSSGIVPEHLSTRDRRPRTTSRRARASWSCRRTPTRCGSRRSPSCRRVSSGAATLTRRERRADDGSPSANGARGPRAGSGRAFAAPATLYLLVFFVFPFYVVLAVTFGGDRPDPASAGARPGTRATWNHGDLQLHVVEHHAHATACTTTAFIHTFVFVGIATVLCLLIGYPFAYFLARRAGRYKGLFLVLFFAPFWISYMLRMLAWISLLQDDGYVNKVARATGRHQPALPVALGQAAHADLRAGLRLRAVHDPAAVRDARPDPPVAAGGGPRPRREPRAGRSGGSRCRSPRQAILAGFVICALPMFGDYFTQQLLADTPKHADDRQRHRGLRSTQPHLRRSAAPR